MARKGPDHRPTSEKRRMVEILVAGGATQRTIARAMGITGETLRKHYRQEIELGLEQANARVVQRLFTSIQQGSVAAAIFWLKARAGWKEGHKVEIERAAPAFKNLSKSDRDKLRRILTKTGEVIEHDELVETP